MTLGIWLPLGFGYMIDLRLVAMDYYCVLYLLIRGGFLVIKLHRITILGGKPGLGLQHLQLGIAFLLFPMGFCLTDNAFCLDSFR